MAENICLAPDASYILIHSTGKPDLASFQAVIQKALVLHLQTGIQEVLVDARARQEVPELSKLYEGAEHLAQTTRGKLRFAIVYPDHVTGLKFFESTSTNRGASVALFTDYDRAVAWLISNTQ